MNVFISHTHEDKPIADAVSAYLKKFFEDSVQVRYSSDSSPDSSGPRAGEDWFGWIKQQITDSPIAIVMLTPRSISKPWVLWESGAVSGVSIATASTTVIPMLFEVPVDDIPEPLRFNNVVIGNSMAGIVQLLGAIHKALPDSIHKFDFLCEKLAPEYMRETDAALKQTDAVPATNEDERHPFVLKEWGQSLSYPVSVVVANWQGMSHANDGIYETDDLVEDPWIFDGNGDFFRFYDLTKKDDETPYDALQRMKLTSASMMDSLTRWMSPQDMAAFRQDQARLAQEVILKDRQHLAFRCRRSEPVTTKAPIKLGPEHPLLPNRTFLPCLLAKRHQGDFPAGAHTTYLLIAYVDISSILDSAGPIS